MFVLTNKLRHLTNQTNTSQVVSEHPAKAEGDQESCYARLLRKFGKWFLWGYSFCWKQNNHGSNIRKFDVEKFNGKGGFGLWKCKMKCQLELLGLYSFLKEEPASTLVQADWTWSGKVRKGKESQESNMQEPMRCGSTEDDEGKDSSSSLESFRNRLSN